MIAVLAGGTGGAKLARGLCDTVAPESVAVIANTADDVEVYGVHVSPDPDLVTYWLADLIDERGWGIRGDTWHVMEALAEAGAATWFALGDRDLATCLLRTQALRRGESLTAAQRLITRGLGVSAQVLPMSDDPVRTEVRTAGRWRAFQRFMIEDKAKGPIDDVRFLGIEDSRPTDAVLSALASAQAIVIGPSNPVISIGPILSVPGIRAEIARASAPVVAVSPFVRGRAVKGPTEAFLSHINLAPGACALTELYKDLVSGLVADEEVANVPTLCTDVLMDTAADRRRLAADVLDFAQSLGARPRR